MIKIKLFIVSWLIVYIPSHSEIELAVLALKAILSLKTFVAIIIFIVVVEHNTRLIICVIIKFFLTILIITIFPDFAFFNLFNTSVACQCLWFICLYFHIIVILHLLNLLTIIAKDENILWNLVFYFFIYLVNFEFFK
jgi:hypothetical protein